MIGDTANHFAQVGFGIEAVELCGFDESTDCGGAFTAGVGSCEQIVLAAQGERSDCALGGVVADLQRTVIEIARQRGPA